jgi:hypothetical protein
MRYGMCVFAVLAASIGGAGCKGSPPEPAPSRQHLGAATPEVELSPFLECVAAQSAELRPIFQADPGKNSMVWSRFCASSQPGERVTALHGATVDVRTCCDQVGLTLDAGATP